MGFHGKWLSGLQHTNTWKNRTTWTRQVKCQWLCHAWGILQIYEMSVYLFKWKCLSLFVSVLQWIKDALIEKHLFIISGTNCYWTAGGALDRGIVMAGLALREPSFNRDRRGLWINLHSQSIFFFTLCWLKYTHVSFILHMSTEMLRKPNEGVKTV